MYSFRHLPATWLEGVTLPLQDWRCKRGTHHQSTAWWEGGPWHVYEVHQGSRSAVNSGCLSHTKLSLEQESRCRWAYGLRLNIPALSGAFGAPFNTRTWARGPCTQHAACTRGFWRKSIHHTSWTSLWSNHRINQHTRINKHTQTPVCHYPLPQLSPRALCLIRQYLLTTVYDLSWQMGPIHVHV